jgi:hypothetical protein
LIKPLRRKRILGNGNGNEKGNGNGNENENANGIGIRCVIEHHNTQYASVDTINRDNERSQP